MMFEKLNNFTPVVAPFVKQSHGPEWFTREFHAPTADHEVESTEI